MRRTLLLPIILVAAGLLIPAALFAASGGPDLPSFLTGPQTWEPQVSELGKTSFGVFGTSLDSLFTLFHVDATAGFGTVASPMIVGGVDNLFGGAAVGGTPFTPAPPTGATPFYAGYYSPGTNPWSVYGYINQSGSNDTTGGTTYDLTPSSTPPGSTTTYNWVQQQTVTTGQARPLASVNNDFLQGLVTMGSFTGGLGIKLNVVDNALATNNGTVVVTRNYDKTPTAPPTPTLDYTITTKTADARNGIAASTFDIALGVPLLLKMGSMTHYITVGFEDAVVDASHSQSVTYTSPQDPASALATYQNTNTNVVANGSTYNIPIGYALFLPPIIGGSKKNQFIVTADTFINIQTAQSTGDATTANFNYPGLSAASTPGQATDTQDAAAFTNGLSFKIGAGAVHSLYFTPATGVEYGIVPAFYMDYVRLGGGPSLTSTTHTVRTDVNGNGVFTDAGDSTITTTTTYGNANSGATGIVTTDQFEAMISIPMVLKIMPQGWIFGFTLATTPEGWYNVQQVSTASMTTTQTLSTQLGSAAATTATTQSAPSVPATNVTNTRAELRV
jgi:hypothetical protein